MSFFNAPQEENEEEEPGFEYHSDYPEDEEIGEANKDLSQGASGFFLSKFVESRMRIT
jgi:hypothetical protein